MQMIKGCERNDPTLRMTTAVWRQGETSEENHCVATVEDAGTEKLPVSAGERKRNVK